MHKQKGIKINSRLDIKVANSDAVLKSQIQEIEADSFLIRPPMYKGSPYSLQDGEKVGIIAFADNACYKFISQVLGKRRENGLEFYELMKPQRIKKIERRNFVRTKVSLTVKYEVLINYEVINADHGDIEVEWEKIKPSKQGYSLDLSGGGMRVFLPESLPENSLIVLGIPLNTDSDKENLKVLGRVVRLEGQSSTSDKNYLMGIKFEKISETKQELIIRFVFEIMRRQRYLRRSDS